MFENTGKEEHYLALHNLLMDKKCCMLQPSNTTNLPDTLFTTGITILDWWLKLPQLL